MSEDTKTARAIQRQTNFHKNACGCLVLILLAPLWIPAALVGLAALGASDSGQRSHEHLVDKPERTFPVVAPPARTPMVPLSPAIPAPPIVRKEADPTKHGIVYTADRTYHISKTCPGMNGKPSPATIEKAIELRMRECPQCAAKATTP